MHRDIKRMLDQGLIEKCDENAMKISPEKYQGCETLEISRIIKEMRLFELVYTAIVNWLNSLNE